MQWLLLLCVLIAGCAGPGYQAPISDQAKYDLSKPIDCSTSKQDIETLEREKADVTDQAKSGVKMFVPAAAARAVLHGDYLDRKEVATGEYNQDIDNKIKEIKQRCGE
jgi:hypothetical protein